RARRAEPGLRHGRGGPGCPGGAVALPRAGAGSHRAHAQTSRLRRRARRDPGEEDPGPVATAL
ncbi:MAG: hypothetical protein AVDCRST_MAG48-1994, partial [uncultured Friedmanniella sp.]